MGLGLGVTELWSQNVSPYSKVGTMRILRLSNIHKRWRRCTPQVQFRLIALVGREVEINTIFSTRKAQWITLSWNEVGEKIRIGTYPRGRNYSFWLAVEASIALHCRATIAPQSTYSASRPFFFNSWSRSKHAHIASWHSFHLKFSSISCPQVLHFTCTFGIWEDCS